MSRIDLGLSLVCASGPGGSGKSNFFRYLFSRPVYDRHLIYDTQSEFDSDDYNVYRPKSHEYPEANQEFNDFLRHVLTWPRSVRPRFIHLADGAEVLPGGNKTIGSNASRLIQKNTHIYPGLTFSVSARRPGDIDSMMRDLADHWFVFGGQGSGTKRDLRDIHQDLWDVVQSLDEYHFAHVPQNGDPTVYGPVSDMGEYDRI